MSTIELSENVINAIADAVVKKMQEPKTGHWIDIMVEDMPAQVCDQCRRFYPLSCTGGGYNYCPSCGSRMIEPQESEE